MTIDEFIVRLTIMFGPPDSVDNAAYLDELRDTLKGTHPRVLDKAKSILRDTHLARSWPSIAAIKAAVAEAAFSIKLTVPPEHKPFPKTDDAPADPEASARVQALVKAATEKLQAIKGPTDRSDPPDWIKGQRPGFDKMQRESTTGLHIERGMK
jgi:citrate lyase beta subunit